MKRRPFDAAAPLRAVRKLLRHAMPRFLRSIGAAALSQTAITSGTVLIPTVSAAEEDHILSPQRTQPGHALMPPLVRDREAGNPGVG